MLFESSSGRVDQAEVSWRTMEWNRLSRHKVRSGKVGDEAEDTAGQSTKEAAYGTTTTGVGSG